MVDHLGQAMRWIANDCAETMTSLEDVTIVFMGDYIDRGPASRAVLDMLMLMRDTSPPTIVILRGNHDEMMLQALRYRSKTHEVCWLQNGGLETLKNYEKPVAARGFERSLYDDAVYAHLDFIESMDLFYEDEHRVYVHAGVRGSFQRMGLQQPFDLLWIRPSEMDEAWPAGMPVEPKLVVHGHTPGHPGIPEKTFGIDGGACFDTGHLKVVKFDDQHRDPIHIQEIRPIKMAGVNDNKVKAA
jgi:serine/threonine protein phosphatase 1